jgi:signal transduction histidine kinase
VSIRLRIALLTCLTSLGAVGITGAMLMSESRAHATEELKEKQLLLAQSRAYQLGYNLQLATRELVRLSRMAEVDLSDDDVRPEATLLAHAHRNSTLFNTGLQIVDASGRCLWSEPHTDECPGRSFAGDAWFKASRDAEGPLVFADRPAGSAPTLVDLVVPIRPHPERSGPPSGVLRGILDLRTDPVVSPSLTSALPAATEAALATRNGALLFPGKLGSSWAPSLAAAAGPAGVLLEGGYLYAHAPVAATDWGLVYRWPYAALDDGQQRLMRLLSRLLAAGGALAIALGLLTSRFLSRPINVLVHAVRRLGASRAAGQPPPATSADDAIARRSDELGELARAFAELRGRLAEGDEQHRQDLDKIREMAASLEERVRQRTTQLEEAQRSLLAQERLAAMGQAAAVISHELKNSLGAIGMGVDLIAGEAGKSEALRRVHAQVRTEVTRLRTLTDELLVFARGPRIERRREDLRALVRRAAAVCSEQAEAAAVRLEGEAPDAEPLWAECDAERIQSVLVNLMQNGIEAVAFGSDGEPKRERVVRVRAQPPQPGGPPMAVIAVEDSGPGVDARAAPHLFEPFFTTKRNGTGLGLATAQRFVAAHGGRIELQAGQRGARFAVLLPASAKGPR